MNTLDEGIAKLSVVCVPQSSWYAKEMSFCKIFCLTNPTNITGGLFMSKSTLITEKFWRNKRRYHNFGQKNCHTTEKLRRGTLWCFAKLVFLQENAEGKKY